MNKEEPVKLAYVPVAHAKAGEEIQPTVTVQIKKGWHLFSQQPEVPGIKPTKLTVASQAADVVKIQFPKPEKAYSSIFEKQITFYQDTVTIPVVLKVKPGTSGSIKIDGQLEFQACSESLCMPPAKKKFSGEQKLLE